MTAATWTLADFDYDLPPELVAQHPAPERTAARLLDGTHEPPVDRHVRDWPALLRPGDLVVLNDTRVIKARLRGRKASGGAVELLVERVLPDGRVWAHLRASRSPGAGQVVRLEDAFDASVLGRTGPEGALFVLQFPGDPFELLERHGHVPLPPYIAHADAPDDVLRYQTVFARVPGAVAAPTASLHLDEALLAQVAARGVRTATVTLHVGAGTFQPVREGRIEDHRMHHEWFEVPASTADAIEATRRAGGRVVAVGTTVVRALESAARLAAADRSAETARVVEPVRAETDIFIRPGHRFAVVDALLTNFHLPRSTLLMLVSAFAGHARIRALYAHAVAQRYRFFSYGDAMWLERRVEAR